MADNDGRAFWHIDLVGVLTVLVLVAGITGGYTELKLHEQMTREGLSDVAKEAKEFHGKMMDFARKQEGRESRQDQIDRDCPRHRHGKHGQIFYCGQAEPTFSEAPPIDDDPPADMPAEQKPKP